MENRTEIGKVIKNKLTHLDKNPSDFVWSKIETDLNKKRNKRILSWMLPSVIAFLLFSTLLYFNSDFQDKNQRLESSKKEIKINAVNSKSDQNPTQNPGKKSKSNSELKKSGPDEITTIKKSKTVKLVKESSKLVTSTDEYEEYEVVKKYKVVIKKEQVSAKPIKLATVKKLAKPKIQKNKQLALKGNKNKKGKSKKIVINHNKTVPAKPAVSDPVKKTEAEKEILNDKQIENSPKIAETKIDSLPKVDSLKTKKSTTPKREYKKTIYNTQNDESDPDFTVSVFYGPAISGSLNSESMISPAMNDLSKSHPITSHYGIYVKTMYDRIGFRAGFSKISLKTTTRLDKDVLIPNYTNIELKSETNINQTFSGSNEVNLLQKISYYELPMEFDYAIKKDESKIGMDVFTGFSFLLLDKNQLFLESEKVAKQQIGEAKNISGINFSYNLGIGISYKLNDKFNLDINPLFKYYLSTFKESGDAKPYSFSLQSGVSYKF
ncbi:hypothetical protein IR010_16060 [Flavobacterium sp. MR2016-29]|uniref:hypothetical protein n=1 Tax=Flavobacterium sp. MR2016-29 TaxID=2783795 RepID=UPI00188C6E93|nr:hypothetical protein [Flavobacterium sp. MR2016-29]MBF4494065.1 hypothetical protein [Flavobacterium sp. MR2016-29]